MEKQGKVILVSGATGNQGGALAQQLIADGWQVRTLTRDPGKPSAQALAGQGMEVVQGDLNDSASLAQALQGVYGVFSVQNFWEHGYEGEIKMGQTLAEAAQAAGVQHLVYSSVGGAERKTGIPHFDSKWVIEEHLNGLDVPATVIRPVFFMENFKTFMRPQPQGDSLVFSAALKADKPLQMIAVEDIGAFAALAFAKPEEFAGQSLEIAGDELTPLQIAEALGRGLGQSVSFVEMPIEQVRSFDKESAKMFEWFNESGYQADIPALRTLHPGLLTFEQWVAKTDW